ncbi:NAD(P)H-binding protein [Actinoallomurus purpureus]|uniref:NAD(P)-dependent oxidoreductase n=1 Tax=Actinoallomurus purpureus TaxID=478114 RepID=UPI002093F335|nr:NAD(P)H-binding protein [Actinoallomurus purpureus]MCO6004309.1 NAD(P)H-binding protein [Actinoallomurus purpureus]
MSTVTIFGATGYAGGAITTELLDRGHAVVAVARSTSTLTERANLTVVSGSLHDPAVLAQATKGADVILVALPAGAIDGVQLIDALPSLLTTAAEGGARLGIMGGAGSLQTSPDGPLLVDSPDFPASALDEALRHKAILEALRSSGTEVDWFYVSPAAGFGSWNPGNRTGRYRTGGDVLLSDSSGNSNISAADLAIAFAEEVEHPAHHRERFHVAY